MQLKFLNEKSKTIFFFLTIAFGILLTYPVVDYQSILSTGDHGRDLYAFERTLEGEHPYKDYWWVYGPLMPYYYSLFFKWLGIQIPSILMGKYFLVILSSVFFYLTLSCLVNPSFAFLGAVWFLVFQQDFFFTYNHAGGLALSLATTCSLFFYLKSNKIKYLYSALTCVFFLMFVKINFGAGGLLCVLLTIFLSKYLHKDTGIKSKKKFYFWACILMPLTTFVIYLFLLKGLPLYVIRQCFPYFGNDYPYHTTFNASSGILLKSIFLNIKDKAPNIIFAVLMIGTFLHTIQLLRKKEIPQPEKKLILLSLILLSVFYLIHAHEFFLSGVYYTTFWASAFSYLLMFLLLGLSISRLTLLIRVIFFFVFFLIILFRIINGLKTIQSAQNPWQYFSLPKAKIFVGNHPFWIQTVSKTTEFLQENLNPNELFLTLPYDPLYYYLTSKKSPTPQLIFFEHINIQEEQEKNIIREIEEKKVNWIVLSSRAYSEEPKMGFLGKTYCPLMGKYLEENFKTEIELGDWVNPPGWGWGHGVKILKRIER